MCNVPLVLTAFGQSFAGRHVPPLWLHPMGRLLASRVLVLAVFVIAWVCFDPRSFLSVQGTSPQLLRRAQAGSRSRLARRAAEKGFAGLRDVLKVQAVGQGRGSFILEMGGVKVLVNPNLEGSQLKPEAVHEEFDYVFLSSEEPEFFHRDTVSRMKLTKVKFVASAKAGQELTKMMVRNLAVLQNGPGGQCYLQGRDNAAAAIGILSAPGAGGMPWERQEQAFIFVNLENGAAVAYEAYGQFLGKNAGSNKPGIPEEAYQVDYLITPDLREAAGVTSGLAEKGADILA
ncbi:unnamed protein product, partial [Effrenium voratum]